MIREGFKYSGIELEKRLEKERKELAEKYINFIHALSECISNGFDVHNEEHLKLLDEVSLIVKFLKDKSNGVANFFNHDTKAVGTRVTATFLSLKKGSTDFLDILENNWTRFAVSIEDILLRVISDKEVDKKFQQGFDVELLKDILDFFVEKEIVFMKSDRDNYAGLSERNWDSLEKIDWDKNFSSLKDKKVKGNSAVVINFLLNALRNSLKDRIQVHDSKPTKVSMDVNVETSELIIAVEDSGKGMEERHLDREQKEFIFTAGNSDTGSTGLGLTGFNNRLATMGGEIRIFSRREKQGEEEKPYVYYSYFGEGEVFTTFLKREEAEGLVESKIENHGTRIEIYLPLE